MDLPHLPGRHAFARRAQNAQGRRAPRPAHAPGVLQPLVAADDTQSKTFAHAVAHEKALRPYQLDPPSGQPVREGCRSLLDPQQARQVPRLDVIEPGYALKDHRGPGHPVDPSALDQLHDAVVHRTSPKGRRSPRRGDGSSLRIQRCGRAVPVRGPVADAASGRTTPAWPTYSRWSPDRPHPVVRR